MHPSLQGSIWIVTSALGYSRFEINKSDNYTRTSTSDMHADYILKNKHSYYEIPAG